jgi:hypothetical protein
MNDLQLALLGVGGALVVGVWGHGKWQEVRQRKLAERLLNPEGGDPLMERKPAKPAKGAIRAAAPAPVERLEPVIKVADVTESSEPGIEPEPAVPAASASFNRALPERAADIGEPSTALVSNEADYIARFSLPELMSGEQLLAIPRDPFSLLRKRVVWAGYDEAGGQWEAIRPEGIYRELRIGMQLADRSGAINASLLEQFKRAVENVGDELTALPELPNPRDAVARAINLDRLCAEVDIQLAVYLAPRHDHFSPDAVRDAALARGFKLASDGVLGFHDASGERLFMLQMPDARAPDGLPSPTACCILEVPCVTHGELAFDRMMQVAENLAENLEAMLVDEHRRPVTERFVAPVRQQIGQLQSRMGQQGVVAGSALALRLFA